MESWHPELRDLEYGSKRARLLQRRSESPGRPLLLVLGSSRAALGFRPDALPPLPGQPVVFNASLMGAGPVLELVCLRRVLDEGIHPDWLLLECWPPYWNQEGAHAEADRLAVTRFAWRDVRVLRHYTAQPDQLVQRWSMARVVPWSSSRFMLLEQFARDWLPCAERRDDQWRSIDGFGWLPFHWISAQGLDRHAIEVRGESIHRDMAHVLNDYRISTVADRALHDLLALCRREHIRVVMIVLPEAKVFKTWYAPGARGQVDQYLQRLSEECAVPLVDARDWSPDTDFGDPIHLLPEGARTFTERCAREVLPALLQDRIEATALGAVP
jgi:hypothetical protein